MNKKSKMEVKQTVHKKDNKASVYTVIPHHYTPDEWADGLTMEFTKDGFEKYQQARDKLGEIEASAARLWNKNQDVKDD